jgi:hypothetical protein
MKLIEVDGAAGTTLTNATAETVLKYYSFPAGFWHAGKVVEVTWANLIPSTNSTDTLAVRGRFGAAALTGTVVADGVALDVANDDVSVGRTRIICRSVDAAAQTGVFVCSSLVARDAAATVAGGNLAVVSSLPVNAATFFGVTGQWSVASASNQVACQFLTVEEGTNP